jgi:hypothetical protein
MSTQAHKANEGLDLSGKTAVIAGGSQGIGTFRMKQIFT